MSVLAPKSPEDTQAKRIAFANYIQPTLILMDHLERFKY